MRFRTLCLVLLLAGSFGVIAIGCSVNDAISPDGSPPPPPGFKLVPDVLGVLTNPIAGSPIGSACSTMGTCHGSGLGSLTITAGESSNALWTMLTKTVAADGKIVVIVTNFSVSELLTKPDQAVPGVTHTGGKVWNSSPSDPTFPSYQSVMRWASNGALDN